jgi:hypothetical protein
MPPSGVAGAVAGAAAAASLNREEERAEAADQIERMKAVEEIFSHIEGNLPPIPEDGNLETLRQRKEALDSPATLLQDPLMRNVVGVIQKIILEKADAYEAALNKYNAAHWTDRWFGDASRPSSDGVVHARIKEVLQHFGALEKDAVVARLQILEKADLIDYHMRYISGPVYSPTPVSRENPEIHFGFTMSDRLWNGMREFLSSQESEA